MTGAVLELAISLVDSLIGGAQAAAGNHTTAAVFCGMALAFAIHGGSVLHRELEQARRRRAGEE